MLLATEGKRSLTLEHIICTYINKVNMSNRSVTNKIIINIIIK